ncbi:unnamed protein product, partial [Meganyctiphanes norvegica]
DIDECVEGSAACNLDEKCINTLGGHQCQGAEGEEKEDIASSQCQPGFSFNITARTCTDIDECSGGGNDCSPMEECVNKHGSYQCQPIIDQQEQEETTSE